MTSPLDRARQLIALATGETTPVEEARSAAMALAKLVAKHEMLNERRGLFDTMPAQHCAGCLCFSNTLCTCDRSGCRMHDRPERGEPARPRPPPAPQAARDPFWDDAFRTPEDVTKKRYGEGWERIWGENRRAHDVVCTCSVIRRSILLDGHDPICPLYRRKETFSEWASRVDGSGRVR